MLEIEGFSKAIMTSEMDWNNAQNIFCLSVCNEPRLDILHLTTMELVPAVHKLSKRFGLTCTNANALHLEHVIAHKASFFFRSNYEV